MFGNRYFGQRYFGDRYFGPLEGSVIVTPVQPPILGGAGYGIKREEAWENPFTEIEVAEPIIVTVKETGKKKKRKKKIAGISLDIVKADAEYEIRQYEIKAQQEIDEEEDAYFFLLH